METEMTASLLPIFSLLHVLIHSICISWTQTWTDEHLFSTSICLSFTLQVQERGTWIRIPTFTSICFLESWGGQTSMGVAAEKNFWSFFFWLHYIYYKYTNSLIHDVFLCLSSIQSLIQVSIFSNTTVLYPFTTQAPLGILLLKVTIVCISDKSYNQSIHTNWQYQQPMPREMETPNSTRFKHLSYLEPQGHVSAFHLVITLNFTHTVTASLNKFIFCSHTYTFTHTQYGTITESRVYYPLEYFLLISSILSEADTRTNTN